MSAFHSKAVALLAVVLLFEIPPTWALPSIRRSNSSIQYRHELVRRDLPGYPTAEDCEAALNSGMPPQDKAMFYTKTNYLDAGEYAEGHGLAHINDQSNYVIWNPSNFFDPSLYMGTDAERDTFFDDLSRTYASHASGIAYLQMPYGENPSSTGIFYRVEYPAMRDGGLVSKIIWLDVGSNAPDDPTSITKTWWVQGDADPATDSVSATSSAPSCSLGNYPAANHCPLNDGISYLHDQGDADPWCTPANECTMPSCSYGTGIQVCNDNDVEYCLSFLEISDEVYELQSECDPNWNVPNYDYYYNYEIDCSTCTTPAMQQFFDDGHNVLVMGGFDC